jgi:putative membrane protein
MQFVGTWIVTAIAAAAAAWLVPGMVTMGGFAGIALFALTIALINASVRPIMQALSLPLTIITLGIFHLVVNALALMLSSWLTLNLFGSGVYITNFWSAFFGSIVISLVSAVVGSITGLED